MAQNEDGQGLSGPPELQRFRQAADGQPGGTLLGEDPGALHGTVAVAVGLDHRAQGQPVRPGLHRPEIGTKRIQIDLGPDVFFKRLILHGKSLPFRR